MKSRIAIGVVVASLATLALAACSPAATSTTTTMTTMTTTNTSTTSAPATPAGASGTMLATASSSHGTIVVNGTGMAVYEYDRDTKGGTSSACSAGCASSWRGVPAGDALAFAGVTGKVATITGTNGKPQLTLNGYPLYYYAGDVNPGDTNGQAVGGVWWLLTPAGERITK